MYILRNLQEQVKKAFCYQKLFWPFTVWINFSSDLKSFANSRPSASNSKSVSQSLEQFFLTVGQNKFGNKIPFLFPLSFSPYWSLLDFWKIKLDELDSLFILNLNFAGYTGSKNQVQNRLKIKFCQFFIFHKSSSDQ